MLAFQTKMRGFVSIHSVFSRPERFLKHHCDISSLVTHGESVFPGLHAAKTLHKAAHPQGGITFASSTSFLHTLGTQCRLSVWPAGGHDGSTYSGNARTRTMCVNMSLFNVHLIEWLQIDQSDCPVYVKLEESHQIDLWV